VEILFLLTDASLLVTGILLQGCCGGSAKPDDAARWKEPGAEGAVAADGAAGSNTVVTTVVTADDKGANKI
jgi:hypothetical protein